MPTTDASCSEQEVLSQTEVDQLVAVATESPAEKSGSPGSRDTTASEDRIQPFAFRGESFLTPQELRVFRQEHEAWIEMLSARLSSYLRVELALRLCDVQAVPYRQFVQALPSACHLTLFKVEPWRGICLLDLNVKLALAMSDRLLGGKGSAPAEARELSQVEVALLDQAVQLILEEWCGHWTKFQPLTPVVLGHETCARFLRVAQPDAMMVTVVLEARLGESIEQIQLAFPGTTLELLLQDLRLKTNFTLEPTSGTPASTRPKWKRDFDDLPVGVEAQWSGLRMTTGQIAKLAVGDVVPLPPEFSARIRLCLGNVPKFVGRLGCCDGNWAVEIAEVLRTAT